MRRGAAIAGAVLALAGTAVVLELTGPLRPGETAPLFEAPAADGTAFRLADHRGRTPVVISFYPKDFSAGCTQQVCSYRDNYARIGAFGAVLVGISPDPPDSHRAFAERHGLPFTLVSDADRSVARAYGVLRLWGLLPLNKRVTFVLDRQGTIRATIHRELAIGGHLEGILAALEELRREEAAGRGEGPTPGGRPG